MAKASETSGGVTAGPADGLGEGVEVGDEGAGVFIDVGG
jgi:hypothetical protein